MLQVTDSLYNKGQSWPWS